VDINIIDNIVCISKRYGSGGSDLEEKKTNKIEDFFVTS